MVHWRCLCSLSGAQTVRPRHGYQLPDSLAVVILNGLGMVGLFTVSNVR
jgi:hypothetical protein